MNATQKFKLSADDKVDSEFEFCIRKGQKHFGLPAFSPFPKMVPRRLFP